MSSLSLHHDHQGVGLLLIAGLAQDVLQGGDVLEAVAGNPVVVVGGDQEDGTDTWPALGSCCGAGRSSGGCRTAPPRRVTAAVVTSYFWNLSRSITPTLATLVLHQPLACHLKLVFWRNILFLSEMSIPESLKAVLEVVQSACIGPGLSVLSSYNWLRF